MAISNDVCMYVCMHVCMYVWRRCKRVMLINQGEYSYSYFNGYFMQNMLSLSLYSMIRGYVPHIELKDREEGFTNWDTFFRQPFGTSIDEKVITNSRTNGDITYGFGIAWNKKRLSRFCRLYHALVRYNDETRQYIDDDYNAIISPGERVLGVLCRGTDYLQLRPKGHPVQPSVEEMIEKVRSELSLNRYDKIYLATEDEQFYKQFVTALPEYEIITNKRQYFGDLYNAVCENRPLSVISDVTSKHSDNYYWRGIQYLSSMDILSRCDALVAGNCGGTCLALLMNNMKYKRVYVFNLGFYE